MGYWGCELRVHSFTLDLTGTFALGFLTEKAALSNLAPTGNINLSTERFRCKAWPDRAGGPFQGRLQTTTHGNFLTKDTQRTCRDPRDIEYYQRMTRVRCRGPTGVDLEKLAHAPNGKEQTHQARLRAEGLGLEPWASETSC